jgi:hypothetical protein
MNWPPIFTTAGMTAIFLSLFIFLTKNWIKARLEESIAHEYQKALERYKTSLQWESHRREQAVQIADMISVWVAPNYDPSLDKKKTMYETQRKYWELVLWLDPEVLKSLNKAFRGEESAVLHYKEAMIAVRKSLLGDSDDIEPKDIVTWMPEEVKGDTL